MAADPKERDFMPFKRLFREIQLQTDVGIKLHKMKRTEWDHQFYAVFKELCHLLDPVQEHQEQLALSEEQAYTNNVPHSASIHVGACVYIHVHNT